MADDDIKKKDLEEDSEDTTDENVENSSEESTDESIDEVVETNPEDTTDENEEITLESTNEAFNDEAYIRALEEMSKEDYEDYDFLSDYKEGELKNKQKKFEKENGLNESDLDSPKEEDNIDD